MVDAYPSIATAYCCREQKLRVVAWKVVHTWDWNRPTVVDKSVYS